jgi:hypothetical protein
METTSWWHRFATDTRAPRSSKASLPAAHGATQRVESGGPVLGRERLRRHEASGHTIEHVVEAVLVGEEEEFPVHTGKLRVDQGGNLDGIVIVGIMGRELEMPHDLAAGCLERDDRIGVEVVARPTRAIVVGRRIPNAEITRPSPGS